MQYCSSCGEAIGSRPSIKSLITGALLLNALSWFFVFRPRRALLSITLFAWSAILAISVMENSGFQVQAAAIAWIVLLPLAVNIASWFRRDAALQRRGPLPTPAQLAERHAGIEARDEIEVHNTSVRQAEVIAIALFLTPLLMLCVGSAGAEWISRSRNLAVGAAPAELGAKNVALASRSGATLACWFAEPEQARARVALFHGIGSTRLSMVDRALFLKREGYAVMLCDFRGHGESGGGGVTFGARESRDVDTQLSWLRRRVPALPIAAIGSSLGAASCLLGENPLDADALVVEASYTTIEQAAENRLTLRLGALGPALTQLLLWRMPAALDTPLEDLRPIMRIAELRCPVFVMGGENDRRTTSAETQALYEEAPQPKDLWLVPGATHVDLHRYAGEEYERRVLAFLERSLFFPSRPPVDSSPGASDESHRLPATQGFSWIIPGELAAMPLPGRDRNLTEDARFFQQEGIRVLVSLTENPPDAEVLASRSIHLVHIPVEDFTAPTLEQMNEFVTVVEDSVAAGHPVAVHCTAGLGRSGTMAAAYLVSRGSSAERAIATVRHLRPGSIETAAQETALERFAKLN